MCTDAAGGEPIGIVPLMHRHEVEPSDALTRTMIRHAAGAELTPVAPTATAVFFGASYHADYATLLAAPGDLAAVAEAVADHLADTTGRQPWDVVDLRRLRCGDPAADALAAAFGAREMAEGWTLNVEREDVCPVVTLPAGVDMDGYLGTLGKKERHEIRRKVRRAEAVGEVVLADSSDPLADLEAFIDLHQKRWGDARALPGHARRRAEPRLHAAAVRAERPGRAAAPDVPDGRGPADRRRGPFRDGRRLPLLQRRHRPRRARPVARRRDDPRLRRSGPSRPASAGSTSCAATSPTSTSGARSTSRSSGCWCAEGARRERAARRSIRASSRWCGPRWPRDAGSASSRCSRPAPTAAPRSTCTRWSRGSTASAMTCRSWRCRRGVPCASSCGRAWPSSSSTTRTTRSPSARWPPICAEVRADVVHAHMYRAEIVGDAGRHRARRGGAAPAVPRGHDPLEPDPLARGPAAPRSS